MSTSKDKTNKIPNIARGTISYRVSDGTLLGNALGRAIALIRKDMIEEREKESPTVKQARIATEVNELYMLDSLLHQIGEYQGLVHVGDFVLLLVQDSEFTRFIDLAARLQNAHPANYTWYQVYPAPEIHIANGGNYFASPDHYVGIPCVDLIQEDSKTKMGHFVHVRMRPGLQLGKIPVQLPPDYDPFGVDKAQQRIMEALTRYLYDIEPSILGENK